MNSLGAPELLIVLFLFGLPVGIALVVVMTVSTRSSRSQRDGPPVAPTVHAGWYADPSRRFEVRYHDGARWTEHVARGSDTAIDPPSW